MGISIKQSKLKREYCGDIDLKIGTLKLIPLSLEEFLELKMVINGFKYKFVLK